MEAIHIIDCVNITLHVISVNMVPVSVCLSKTEEQLVEQKEPQVQNEAFGFEVNFHSSSTDKRFYSV